MRRTAAGLIGAGLIGALIMPAALGSFAAAAPAAREGCTWRRHSRRVVRQVRRDGRRRAVRRVRHWWTCEPPPAAPPATPAPFPIEEPPLEEVKPAVSHLSVKAVEWSYTLSRPEVSSGEVVVELNNEGEDNHNLKLQREGSDEPPLAVPEAASAERTSARLNLPPGTYQLYCSLFQHREKGMHATLVVGGG